MTPQMLLFLTSVVGALLFFAAGYLAVLPARRPSRGPALLVSDVPVDLSASRDDAARARGEAAVLRGQREALEADLLALQAELAERRLELFHSRERLAAAEERLDEGQSSVVEATLRQDLAVASEALAAHEQRVRRFEAENAQLRQDLFHLSALEAERDRLEVENAQLRASGLTPPPITHFAEPDPVAAPAVQRGDIFQSLVDRVSRLADVRAAVIADELGLVVASHGELSEEVAAAGALFARAGAQVQRVLPLHNVHHITIVDDQDVVLTLCPLRRGSPGDGELALVTLAVGAALDQQAVSRLLEERPRSHA